MGPRGWLIVQLVVAVECVLASATTWRALPHLLRLPSLAELYQANEALSSEAVGRQLAQQAWRVSERRFRAAFDAAATPMLITDQGGRIRRFNIAADQLLGWQGDAPETIVPFVHSDDQATLREGISRLGRTAPTRTEIRLLASRGMTVWGYVSMARMAGPKGPEIVWQIQDVTERRAYEHSLREARERLELKVAERTRELEHANRRLARLARYDSLTGIENRRQLDEELQRAVSSAQRYGHDVSVLMIDIDHFKQVNDSWGHQVGDRVLSTVAATVDRNCRETDVVGRYGGDELCLVLPQSSLEAAITAAEKLRAEIQAETISLPDGGSLSVTCSIGVASLLAGDDTVQTLLERADAALYRAKQAGRNRVHPPACNSATGVAQQPV